VLFREEQCSITLTKEPKEERDTLLSRFTVHGLITAHFGEVGRPGTGAPSLLQKGGGATQRWNGIRVHLIRNEE
jgi:hypothetical protein